MLNDLIACAGEEGLRLATFIGVSCSGIIEADGAIDRGAQNLPGNWESDAIWTIQNPLDFPATAYGLSRSSDGSVDMHGLSESARRHRPEEP